MNQHSIPRETAALSASAVTADTVALPPATAAAKRKTELNAAAQAAASGMSKRAISPVLLAGCARLFEFAVLLAVGAIGYLLYLDPAEGSNWWYAAPLTGGALLAVVLIQMADGYSMPALRGGAMHVGRIFMAWTGVFAVFATIAFLAKIGDTYSRVWAFAWY